VSVTSAFPAAHASAAGTLPVSQTDLLAVIPPALRAGVRDVAASVPGIELLNGPWSSAKFDRLKEQAFRLCGVPKSIPYSPAALKRLSAAQERKFVDAYVNLVNGAGNQLANQPPDLRRLTHSGLKALSISIDETLSGDFKNLPSFKGGRNPFVTLAEKFRFAINPTLGDFAGGYVNSVGDLNNPKHKYSGYRNVIKFNPLNSISGSFEVKVPFAPDGKSRSVKVYVVNDPSSTFRGSNVSGVPVVNIGNIEASIGSSGKSGPAAFAKEVRAQLSIIGANEASHTVFLAKYPELNRTDLRPLRGYSGNQSFKELAANVVFEFFSDVASASIDPLRQISSTINSRNFPQYKLSELVTVGILRREKFTGNDIKLLKEAKNPHSSDAFNSLFVKICKRLGRSPVEIGDRYRNEMIAQGKAINQYLLAHPEAFRK
jgi:hypothetical protein